ncbi:hypothetical protein COCVIDRAFT_115564, partial [Bipolaris victoriae FI3]
RHRLAGRVQHVLTHHYEQRLSPEQEDKLVDWILREGSCTRPSSHALRQTVIHVPKQNSDTTPLSQHWIFSFSRRNPRVRSTI